MWIHKYIQERYNVFNPARSTESSGGARSEAAVALVGALFPAAVLEESFAERLVFSVPQCSVSSLAQCFQMIEEGTCHEPTTQNTMMNSATTKNKRAKEILIYLF